jgi:hypothetical protein
MVIKVSEEYNAYHFTSTLKMEAVFPFETLTLIHLVHDDVT